MLSVFITPWQKPTACQSASSRAVRRLTSVSRASTGWGALRQSG